MRFTKYQYERAIESLQDGMTQLEPDGQNCRVCGDGGHQAFECGHNPLVAMAICGVISRDAFREHEVIHQYPDEVDYRNRYHNLIHYLSGYDTSMGECVGPAKVHLPFES